jgi:hypothetical protein
MDPPSLTRQNGHYFSKECPCRDCRLSNPDIPREMPKLTRCNCKDCKKDRARRKKIMNDRILKFRADMEVQEILKNKYGI